MVFGRIRVADGGIAFMCAGRISMVPAVAAAVHAVGLDAADHHLDSEHHPDLLRLAFAHAWSSVGGSWLDYAAGIRIRGNGRCNYPASPLHPTGDNPILDGLAGCCELGSASLCEGTRASARTCENATTRNVLYNARAPSKDANGVRERRVLRRHTLLHPETFALHPTDRPSNL